MKKRIMKCNIWNEPQKVFDSDNTSPTPDSTNNSTTLRHFKHNSNAFENEIDLDDCGKAPVDDFREGISLGDAVRVNKNV